MRRLLARKPYLVLPPPSHSGVRALALLTLMSCGMAPLSNTLWIWLTDPAAMLLSVQHAYWISQHAPSDGEGVMIISSGDRGEPKTRRRPQRVESVCQSKGTLTGHA